MKAGTGKIIVGVIGLATVQVQRSLLFSGLEGLFRSSAVGFPTVIEKAKSILFRPVLFLLIVLWLWVLSENPLYPSWLDEALRIAWTIISIPLLLFSLVRFLRFLEFLVIFIVSLRVNDELLVEYLRNALPLTTILLALVLGLFICFGLIESLLSINGSSVSRSIFIVMILLGLVTPFRNIIAGLTMLVDGDLQIFQLIELRGISGKLIRIGVLESVLEKNGERFSVPNDDFMHQPYTNHGMSTARVTRVELTLMKVCTVEEVRVLTLEVVNFLRQLPGLSDVKVSYLTPGSMPQHERNREIHEVDVKQSTLVVSWSTVFMGLSDYASQRSRTILQLREFLDNKGVHLL